MVALHCAVRHGVNPRARGRGCRRRRAHRLPARFLRLRLSSRQAVVRRGRSGSEKRIDDLRSTVVCASGGSRLCGATRRAAVVEAQSFSVLLGAGVDLAAVIRERAWLGWRVVGLGVSLWPLAVVRGRVWVSCGDCGPAVVRVRLWKIGRAAVRACRPGCAGHGRASGPVAWGGCGLVCGCGSGLSQTCRAGACLGWVM